MQLNRIASSLWFAIIVAVAANPAWAEDTSGKTTAQAPAPADAPAPKPAAKPAKPRTEAEKAAARAKAEARKQQRLEEANRRQTAAYRAQVESLGLSAEQKSEVDGLAARQAEWTKTNSARISEINERITSARFEGDVQTVKSLSLELQKLMATRPGLQDILTTEQLDAMNAQAVAKASAAREKAGTEPPARPGAQKNGGEGGLEEVYARLKAARQSGDAEQVEKIEAEIYLLKEAVRQQRAKQAESKKPGSGSGPGK